MSQPLLRQYDNHENLDQPYFILAFYCPGCKTEHPYRVPKSGLSVEQVKQQLPSHPCWQWNGSMEKPTFTPSLLCNQGVPKHRCHLFVTNGEIRYCDDCHHDLRGKTVPMVPIED